MAILAMSGAGKSNAAVRTAEVMQAAGIPWVAIDPKGDWYGVRSNAAGDGAGLSVPIFGGLHGDLPLEPTAGRLIAEMVAERRLTCVLDVSEFDTRQHQFRFLADFADSLLRRNRDPLHLFLEEADDYLPQRPSERGELPRCLGAWQRLVKRGRFRGVGATIISQRSAAVNKDVLDMAEALIVLRTTAPLDRKAILGWVRAHAGAVDLVDSLPELADGEAWVWSPQWLGLTARVQFDRRKTFDSGGTPVVGRASTRPTATLADVDLEALRSKMEDAVERAKESDPAELRRRLRDAEQKLAAAGVRRSEVDGEGGAAAELRRRVDELEAAVEDRNVRIAMLALPPQRLAALVQKIGDGSRVLIALAEEAADVAREAVRAAASPLPRKPPGSPGRRPVAAPPMVPSREQSRQPPPAAATRDAGGDLSVGERRILAAVAQRPHGASREFLLVATAYKRSSRDTYLQRLRSRELVRQNGGAFFSTAAGLAALGSDYEPLPEGPELLAYWLGGKLPAGEEAVLRAVAAADEIQRDEIDAATGYKRSSRDTYLQRLRARGLVDTTGSSVRLSEELR
jgi:hypothetical protein